MKIKILLLCLLCCFCFGACEQTSATPIPPNAPNTTETEQPPKQTDGENESTEYTVRFILSVEMDANTFYLSVDGLSKAGEETPSIHTIDAKTVKQGEKLHFLKLPTILNDQTSRYVFSRWEATDGEKSVTVTENTVLSETDLRVGDVTVYPVLKKVKHTENYS